MALISKGFELSVTLVDTGASNSIMTYQLRASDFATATIDATIIIEALDAITMGVISGYRLSEAFANDSFAYPEGVFGTTKASLTVAQSPTGKKANIQISAPVSEIFTSPSGPGAKIVNINHPLVVAYTDLFKSTGQAFLGNGKDLGRVDKGKKTHKKSN
jgi:hypothetical protein